MTDIILPASDLQLLLHLIADSPHPSFYVRYPLYDVALCQYDCAKGQITHSVSPNEFEEAAVEVVKSAPEPVRDELPEWKHVENALLSSGIHRYANERALLDNLEKERERAASPGNPRAAALAFDTNLFYHRLLRNTRVMQALEPDFQLLFSKGVEWELDNAADDKFDGPRVGTFASLFGKPEHKAWVRGMLGRQPLKARLARAGLGDFKRRAKERCVLLVNCEPLAKDARENDRIIARSYADLQARMDITLLTSDQQMLDRALVQGIRSHLLQIPRGGPIPKGEISEQEFCLFLHDLTMAFGVIHLPHPDVTLQAVWSGKTADDWDRDALKVEFNQPSTISRDLPRDLQTVRHIQAAHDKFV